MFQDLLMQLDWTQIVLAVLAAVGGTLAVWYRKRLAVWRKFWRGVLEGLRSVPDLTNDVKGIRYYVSPNGGGSLMDSVRRIEVNVQAQTEQLDLAIQTMWAENDADDEVARFHCNGVGENTYVNQLYARWLSVGKPELLGWNFLNFVHPDDIDRVRKHWEQCRVEHRQYRIRHRMVTTGGAVLTVDVIATPIPEGPPIKRWIGSIKKVA